MCNGLNSVLILIMTLFNNKNFFTLAGLLAFALVFLSLRRYGWDERACMTGAVAALCAVWWIFESVPIPVTSLVPIALLPMFGVLTPAQVGASYGSPLVLLLMGGFILSTAMEKSGAHRRIALSMVNLFGGSSSRRLVFGFMVTSALLSMWISNTATALMLLPVAMAVIKKTDDKDLATPLLLGIAYAASVGGIGTPIGTPPNLIFREIYTQYTGQSIDFFTWMSWGVPVVIILIPLISVWLTRHLKFQGHVDIPAVGGWQAEERRVMLVFALTACAWMTRSQPFGGWSDWLNVPAANDASVALVAVITMFLIPDGKGSRLLDWETASRIPWGMLILFGGGIAIAKAFVISGLSESLGAVLSGIASWDLVLIGWGYLFIDHLSDGDDQQYGHDDINDAHPCCGGYCRTN